MKKLQIITKSKITKKLISFLLSISLFVCLATGFNLNVSALSYEDYQAKYRSFIEDSRWSDGTYWEDYTRPRISSWNCVGCCAYAADFRYYMFGIDTMGDNYTSTNDAAEITAGDIVWTGSHFFVVLERYEDGRLYTAEGNFPSSVVVSDSVYQINEGVLSREWQGTTPVYRIYHHDITYTETPKTESNIIDCISVSSKVTSENVDLTEKSMSGIVPEDISSGIQTISNLNVRNSVKKTVVKNSVSNIIVKLNKK